MWFNIFAFIFVVIILIPNIIFAMKYKDGFINYWNNKPSQIIEQIGRFGCFCFMIFNIPKTWFGFISDEMFSIYIIVNSILALSYCTIWIIYFKKNSIFRSLALSIIPSIIFIFSAICLRSIFLGVFSILFAPTHILISYMNTKLALEKN